MVLANQENFSRWRGLKNLSGSFSFSAWTYLIEGKYQFDFNIKNKGFVSQKIKYIVNNKRDCIHYFSKELIIPPRDMVEIPVKMTDEVLMTLQDSEGLFLTDNLRNKQKILSKKDIQRVLKEYKEFYEKTIKPK